MVVFSAIANISTLEKRIETNGNARQPLQFMANPLAQHQVNYMRIPGAPVMNKAPKSDSFIKCWYDRPAGAFFVDAISVDGGYGYSYSSPFLFVKPFTEYTYYGHMKGADENIQMDWCFFNYDGDVNCYWVEDEICVHVTYGIEISEVPLLYAGVCNPESAVVDWCFYQLVDHDMVGNNDNPIVESEEPLKVFSIPNAKVIDDDSLEVDYWCSSKTMVRGGRDGNNYYLYTYYSGATPAEGNRNGWWFGKNGQHIDGMAQAFEKPTAPYLLKKVGLYTVYSIDKLNADYAKLTCKIYKLDSIPAYRDEDSVSVQLPEVPGELIVSGEGYITPSTIQDNYGFVEFTLFGVDEEYPELTYEYTPTIDYPILVVIEGYNDNPNLQDFSACICTDDVTDEGYGELAYLKYPLSSIRLDENNDTVFGDDGEPIYDFTGEYRWRGLNNFFRSGEMKTGLTIFISTENPFIAFNDTIEDGEHVFPDEGGLLIKDIEINDEHHLIEGIDFHSWYGSEDYVMTWNGDDRLPDWLTINLEDVETSEEEGWRVKASVTAEPLPENVAYREAVIRFEIPGDYIEYKFMQGVKPEPTPYPRGDVNGDGDVSIADVNALIDIILGGQADAETMARADVNNDGDISIADINALIDILLTQ